MTDENTEMNRLLRGGRRGRAPAPTAPATNAEVNATIRGAFGRESPPPPPTAPESTRLDVRAAVASEAGLDLSFADRLRGESVEELAADASRLAGVVAREQAGAAPPPRGFGGGARPVQPTEPSFESALRAQLEDRRYAINHRAADLDHRINNPDR